MTALVSSRSRKSVCTSHNAYAFSPFSPIVLRSSVLIRLKQVKPGSAHMMYEVGEGKVSGMKLKGATSHDASEKTEYIN